VFGFSLGGVVALKAAHQNPQEIRALILEDPALVEFTHLPEDIFAHSYFNSVAELLSKHPSQGDIAAWLKSLDPAMPDDALEIHASRLAKLDPDILVPILGGELVEKHSLDAVLQKITCPILLLQADPALGAATEDQHVALFREFAPQTQVIKIEGARHGIHRTHMHDLLKSVKSFLANLN
jgi:pimeloyl-ACP methyl ester carboxylesterase